MDETYIKMCKEAKEIQELWKPKKGDKALLDSGFIDYIDELWDKKGFTWLPRQEDLQEIFQEAHGNGIHVSTVVNLFYMWFWDEYNNKQKDCCEQYDWNVLWLCFVMERLYGKYWNSKTESWEVIT